MPDFSVSTIFAFQFSLGIVAGLLAIAWLAARQTPSHIGPWLDAGLAALVGGTLGARLLHVILEWEYFSEFPGDVWRVWYGGLDWHGAVIGGLIGAVLVCKLRHLPFAEVSDALALAMPFAVMSGWWACRRAGCAFGKTVDSDTSTWISGFLPDLAGNMAPRLELQILGLWLGFILLVLVMELTFRQRWPGLRLWIMLFLVALSMFVLAFWRGDRVEKIGGLRLDQIFDLLLMLGSAIYLLRQSSPSLNRFTDKTGLAES